MTRTDERRVEDELALKAAGTVVPVPVEDELKLRISPAGLAVLGIFALSVVAFLYFVLPQITGLKDTWRQLNDGNAMWLVVALAFEFASFAGYVALFRAVCVRQGLDRVGWRQSYEITMAALAATRVFAAAGAGGVALTAWALRRAGLEAREVASRMVTDLVILYGVYMAAVVVAGIGLRMGVFPGNAPFAITIVPAILAGAVILLVLLLALVPTDLERRLGSWSHGASRRARIARRAATVPAAIAGGVRGALALTRQREWGLLGAVAWWGFDIGVLWACFHAFGSPPPTAVLVMGYFVGMVGNTLPLPGGIGGVDAGMVGAFVAFGVPISLATVAVLVYRGFSFWLPTLPGAVAYVQLRRTVARWRGLDALGA